MLALLHKELKDFVPEGYNPDGFKSQTEDRERNLEWVLDRLVYCLQETSSQNGTASKDKVAWLVQRASYLEEALVQLDIVLTEVDLPRLLIHADYGPYNLLFRKNAPPIILDFEMARLDWRVTELIKAWYRFCYDKFGFRINKMKYLLEAYQTRFPLTEGELEFIPAVWEYVNIRQCILNWYNYCKTRADVSLARAQKNLKLIEWLTVNRRNLEFLPHRVDNLQRLRF
jgi:Ser/Thr protein kinase RdoA (MazF antagonist)